MPIFVGIDPGKSGGFAVIAADDVAAWRYPGDYKTAADLLYAKLFPAYDEEEILCCIEKVHAMPKQGVTSSFNFGANFGFWQGVLCAFKIPHVLVTPQKWQKATLDAGTGETKERSLQMARRLYPNVDLRFKADDGKADALHMARYARMLHEQGII